jgi:hypothetical protein
MLLQMRLFDGCMYAKYTIGMLVPALLLFASFGTADASIFPSSCQSQLHSMVQPPFSLIVSVMLDTFWANDVGIC